MAAKSPETEHPQKAFGWAARDSSGNLSPFNFSRSEPIFSPKLSLGDPSALTIDDSIVTHPDIHLNSAMAVHGIGTILDYTVYGGDFFAPPVVLPFFPIGKIIGGRRSDAACLCTDFPMVFSIVCAVFAFKIHRNPLAR